MFSCVFCEIFKNNYFVEQLRTATSAFDNNLNLQMRSLLLTMKSNANLRVMEHP